MAMVQTKYEADDGSVHPIKLDQLTAAAAGTPPTGDVDSNIRVQVSKGNREYGIRPRCVKLARTFGSGADTGRKYKTLPVLTPAGFGTPAFAIGGTITIDGVVWVIIAQEGEDF